MSNKRKNPMAAKMLPQIPDINEEIFQRAGISKDDRASLLKKVFDKTVKRLSATHVKTFMHEGNIIYSDPLVDHTTQGKAIDQAIPLVGLQKQEAPKVTIRAEVRLPEWALDEPKNKTIVINAPKVDHVPL